MADSNFRGPITSMGALENQNAGTGTTASANVVSTTFVDVQPLDGPAILYQNTGIPDIRKIPFAKDGFRPGQQQGFLTASDMWAVDNFPQAAGTALAAALQTTLSTTMTLVATQPQNLIPGQAFIAIGVPIIPTNTTVVQSVMALDFGFTTGTTTAASSTVVVLDNTQFTLGQWIIVGGAAGVGATSLIAQVTGISTSNLTGLTISPVAGTGITNAPIGQANLFGGDFLPPAAQFGPSQAVPNAHSPFVTGGLGRWLNPREALARAISVWVGTTSGTSAVVVSGYDLWGNPMTEKITTPSLADRGAAGSTFFGSKAFKYVQGVQLTTAALGSTSVGLSDVFGFPFRADHFGQLEIMWNTSWISYNKTNSVLAAYTTAPSTNTTGDVRGTVQVSTNGTGTAAAVQTAQVSNGTTRLAIVQNMGVWNTLSGTPNNIVPFFGIPQA